MTTIPIRKKSFPIPKRLPILYHGSAGCAIVLQLLQLFQPIQRFMQRLILLRKMEKPDQVVHILVERSWSRAYRRPSRASISQNSRSLL